MHKSGVHGSASLNPLRLDTRELRWQLKQLLQYSPALARKTGLANSDDLQRRFNTDQHLRFAQLRQQYALDDWPRLCDEVEYIENLYVLDLLAQHLPAPPTNGRGLDIGCRNFSHLPALSAFMPGSWDGVELDAHARYWNGHTRRAYGEWMAQQRKDSHYIAGSVLEVRRSYDLIAWILPFILPAPLQAWGLPSRFFQPLALLQHAHRLLKPGGTLLIVNQGDTEAAEQQRLCNEAGISALSLGALHSAFSPFRHSRFGALIRSMPIPA
jgi:SAM-dependent methyltransferase